jgi:GNAT superfamily N-acetyltransferase
MADLRLATPADVPALARLMTESVRGLSGAYYTSAQIRSALIHVFGPDTTLISDRTYFVAEVDGVMAGAGGWSRRRTLFGGDQMKSSEDPLLDPSTEPARIRAFFVHPAWARRGIGRRLFEQCLQDAAAEGFERLTLMSTLPGEPLYRSLGFEVIERLELALPDGVALPLARMERKIREEEAQP